MVVVGHLAGDVVFVVVTMVAASNRWCELCASRSPCGVMSTTVVSLSVSAPLPKRDGRNAQ